MPYSFSTFDDHIYNVIATFQPASVLDVGPGIGKIGSMVAKAARNHIFPCKIDAYEIYEPYIRRYELKWIYDEIWNENIMNIMDKDPNYDMIFFGDSLEHLLKAEGIALLHFLIPKCGFIIIKTPYNLEQGPAEGNKYEEHLSNWEKADFDYIGDLYEYKTEMHVNKYIEGQVDIMNLFILTGTGR